MRFLLNDPRKVPRSWRKSIAWFYPNAKVRKKYLESFGVFMGEGTFSNVGLIPVPSENAKAVIGSHVSIAPYVTLVLHSDPNNGQEIKGYRYVSERISCEGDIIIEDDAWIGTQVVILPGVTIGKCAVIGAGCVMVDDADPYGIYAGVPGKKIGDVRRWEIDIER